MSEWISVKDELPKESGLVWVIHDQLYRWEPIRAAFCAQNKTFSISFDDWHFPSVIALDVTHWILVPAPPPLFFVTAAAGQNESIH